MANHNVVALSFDKVAGMLTTITDPTYAYAVLFDCAGGILYTLPMSKNCESAVKTCIEILDAAGGPKPAGGVVFGPMKAGRRESKCFECKGKKVVFV